MGWLVWLALASRRLGGSREKIVSLKFVISSGVRPRMSLIKVKGRRQHDATKLQQLDHYLLVEDFRYFDLCKMNLHLLGVADGTNVETGDRELVIE
jgi:hypothetical protein